MLNEISFNTSSEKMVIKRFRKINTLVGGKAKSHSQPNLN